MQILQAILLGLLQGVTEFIPVSSSGHLIIAENLLNLDVSSLFFDVMLHFGTLIALVAYFRKDIAELIKSVFRKSGNRLGMWVLVATVPSVIAGAVLQPLAEGAFRSTWLVAFNLFWVALLMLGADKYKPSKKLAQMTGKNALYIGLAQSLALIPGVSRSGITIVAAVGQKYTRQAAARFAFLIAIPITFGAILKLIFDGGGILIGNNIGVFTAGILSAALSGYVAIAWMLKYLATHKLAPFAYYRIALAAVIIVATLVF